MAVANDNSTRGYPDATWPTTGTSFSFAHVITSGTNGYLRVSNSLWGSGTDDVTGVTFNGNALGSLGYKASTSPDGVSVWGLKGQSGTHNVITSVTAINKIQILVDSWTGVDQTTPTGVTVKNNGNGTSLTANGGTVPTNGAMIGVGITHYAGATASQGQTALKKSWDAAASTGRLHITSYSLATGTLTYTSGSSSSYPWAEVVTPLNAAGGSSFNPAWGQNATQWAGIGSA